MARKTQVLVLITLLIFATTSCSPNQNTTPSPTLAQNSSTSTTTPPPLNQTITPTQTEIVQPPISGNDFSFMLQTDFSTYQIIKFPNKTISTFTPPADERQYDLATNLSPSRTYLAFPKNTNDIVVLNLENGQINTFNPSENQSSIFNLDSAQKAAQQRLAEIELSADITKKSLQDAYNHSISGFQWYQNDTSWLISAPGDEDRTNLHAYDLESGELSQLESEPGLIQTFTPGPTGENILINKGILFDQMIWEDDLYYVINVNDGTTQPINLPIDCDLPQVFWFDAEKIGIIHQAKLIGGINFSLFDIETGEMTQVFSGEFTELENFNGNLLILSPESSENSTRVSLLFTEGKISQSIDALCTINHVFETSFSLNCELDSLILDNNLKLTRFDDPIFILSSAPSGEKIISVLRTGEIKLLDANLETEKSITLAEPPLEIHWRPDSSGFIFRSRGKIFWYDLSTESSDLLVESDLFSDYTNVNGIWIGGN